VTSAVFVPEISLFRRGKLWLNRPLSGWWCAVGWILATAIYVGFVRYFEGPTQADSIVSVFSTWAIAHGQWACAYPVNKGGSFPFIAPLYPLLSGALAALTHIGGSVPFPSQAAMGAHCANGVNLMGRWSARSNAGGSTVQIGYLSWLFVMGGVVALLRAAGRGRRGWEPFTLVLLACVPMVWMPLEQYFHPQDAIAIGLILGGVACVLRRRWGWAGVVLGLALMSQQFPWLCLAPLVVVAPANRRFRLVGGVVLATAIVSLPLIVATSGRAFGPALLGSGSSPSPVGGTVLWEFHLHGASLIAFSRVLPILLSMVLARWAVRRLGPGVLQPVPLISLIASALTLRLVFEVNLWGYYFLAVTVSLVVLSIACGRIRLYLLAWLVMVALAFNPTAWASDFALEVPRWLWQVILVPGALTMASDPLIMAVRTRKLAERRPLSSDAGPGSAEPDESSDPEVDLAFAASDGRVR
jgi:hypothetical protein